MTMKKWVAQRNDVHDWDKEKTLSGVYMQSRIVTTAKGDTHMYTIDKGAGKMVDVWGKAMLDDFFKNMKAGTTVEITHLGKVKSKKGGNDYHNFEFNYDDSTALVTEESAKEEFSV